MAKAFAGDAPESAAPFLPSTANFYPELAHNSAWTKSWTLNVTANTLDDQRLTFNIPKLQGGNYTHYSRARVKLRVKMEALGGKDDGWTWPDKSHCVAPINNIGNSLFNSVRLFLNETQVTGSTNGLYHFAAYVNCLACHSSDRKNGILSLGGYFEEGVSPRDPYPSRRWKHMGGAYSGWSFRRQLLGWLEGGDDDPSMNFAYYKDRGFTIYANLMTDLQGTDVPMISDVGGRLEMTLNPPWLTLQCLEENIANVRSAKLALKVLAAELELPVQTLLPSLNLALEKKLSEKPIEYHTTRLDMRKISIPKGSVTFVTDQVKQTATSPDRLLLFLANKSFTEESYGVSPFCFNNFITEDMFETPDPAEAGKPTPPDDQKIRKRAFLTSVKLTLNNETLESSEGAYEPRELARRKLAEFYENMGLEHKPYSVPMTPEEYSYGKFIMVYDLTASKMASMGGGIRQEARAGNLKCELQFNQKTPNESYLFVMSEFHSKVIVDKNRNVTYRYLA